MVGQAKVLIDLWRCAFPQRCRHDPATVGEYTTGEGLTPTLATLMIIVRSGRACQLKRWQPAMSVDSAF